MKTKTAMSWPYLRLELPAGVDPELIGLLTQAALDTGALGGLQDGNILFIYLAQDTEKTKREAIREAVLAEAAGIGWEELPATWETLADFPWATAWKQYFTALPVGRSLLVRPDWEYGEPMPVAWPNRLPLWLRPGVGFGTGHHETTRLALEFLESNMEPGDRVLDFGSGSGILSIAAARLGAAAVTAVEFDHEANENARENLELNSVTARVRIHEANRLDEVTGAFDLVICNMLSHNALPHFGALAERLADKQSLFIYTGFLVEQRQEIEDALRGAGLVTQGFGQMQEWGAVKAQPSGVKAR